MERRFLHTSLATTYGVQAHPVRNRMRTCHNDWPTHRGQHAEGGNCTGVGRVPHGSRQLCKAPRKTCNGISRIYGMVQIGAHIVHARCIGSGQPPDVILAGEEGAATPQCSVRGTKPKLVTPAEKRSEMRKGATRRQAMAMTSVAVTWCSKPRGCHPEGKKKK